MSWSEVPLRRVFRIVNGGTPTSDDQFWNGDVPWATPVDLGPVDGKYLASTQRNLTEEGVRMGSRVVPEDSLILSTRAPIGYIAQTTSRTAFNQGCRGLIPNTLVDMRYFRYQLWALREELVSRGAGSTFMELSTEALAAVPIVAPSLHEQRRIADFLDAETAKIDQIAAIRSLQAGQLDERESSWRSQMFLESDSGAWMRVKHLLRARPRYGVLVPEFVDIGVPFIRVNNLWGLTSLDGLAKIPEELSAQYSRTVTTLGDVLVSVVGSLGKVAVVGESLVGANTARAVAVVRLNPKHPPSLFASWIGTAQFEQQALLVTGADSAQPTLGMEDLANFSVRWPADDAERKAMAHAAIEHQLETAAAQAATNRQLALLAERRQALITAAVTGGISL